MQVKNATFLTSAARAEQFLRPQKPMIAVCGKSNAGKSTLINLLAGRKQLAKTSASPGRTRLVNYFDFGEIVRIGAAAFEIWYKNVCGNRCSACQNRGARFFAQIVEFQKRIFVGTSAVHRKGDDLDAF